VSTPPSEPIRIDSSDTTMDEVQKRKRATLPIDVADGLFLDSNLARVFGEGLSGDYCFADPYPHIVIDNFLPDRLLEEILENFPKEKLQGDKFYDAGYRGLNKRQIHPESCSSYMRNVFNFFNSSPILQFLEGLTTIEALIGDPHFDGGGFHEISTGGKLGIHADFRINEQLHLNRRLNMLIYLNKDWQDSYGGLLELWDKTGSRKVDGIAPIFNRCVIFNTDADSYHGHPDPLNTPPEITRKSIALYYYTASQRVYEDTPSYSTMYVARPDDPQSVKNQVSKSRRKNYLRDWLPPIVLRKVREFKDRAQKSGSGPAED
jgi:hypothetical protein